MLSVIADDEAYGRIELVFSYGGNKFRLDEFVLEDLETLESAVEKWRS